MRKPFAWLALFAILLIVGCGPATASQENRQPTARTVVARLEQSPQPTNATSEIATPLPTLTPADEILPDEETATPESEDVEPAVTAARTLTATITATPTTPPALPLRDDLPPMELQDWPRPENDNGLGIHFLVDGYYDAAELDKQIARIQSMGLKWVVVLYADENHLRLAADKFKDAALMVVWRKTLRPYQRYSSWGRDIEIIKQAGLAPYMQLYNEAELPVEWDDEPFDRELFFANLFAAAKDVYNSGGYPGIQLLDEDWLRDFITQVYARKGEALFHRMFFVAHAYGLNHPPDYIEDMNGVLGFRAYATIFFKRLGFVPPFIVGEGGWKIESHEDNRFPPIDDELHRDYHLAVFDWFRTGKLSNGGPLPDYLFAFCPWMLAGTQEAGAWFDSFTGDRMLTIEAVKKLPPFVRKFSWDK